MTKLPTADEYCKKSLCIPDEFDKHDLRMQLYSFYDVLDVTEGYATLCTQALIEENERLKKSIENSLDKINAGLLQDARTALKQALKEEKP